VVSALVFISAVEASLSGVVCRIWEPTLNNSLALVWKSDRKATNQTFKYSLHSLGSHDFNKYITFTEVVTVLMFTKDTDVFINIVTNWRRTGLFGVNGEQEQNQPKLLRKKTLEEIAQIVPPAHSLGDSHKMRTLTDSFRSLSLQACKSFLYILVKHSRTNQEISLREHSQYFPIIILCYLFNFCPRVSKLWLPHIKFWS